MGELIDFLDGHAARGAYPFHMPGHKGRFDKRDITEIPGADDLRNPSGALARLEGRLARLYGAEAAFLSVNGSSAGILAAVLATVKDGEPIVAARNAHASFFGALALSGGRPVYVMPTQTGYGFAGAVSPLDIDAALAESGAKAAFVTSPTYEGVVSDIAAIAAACRKRGAVLIVDAAHGAHFLRPPFPKGAMAQGAGIAVHSLHKTLPALTQTAAVLSAGAYAADVKRWLNVAQTTSPSYLLMASAERCADMLEERGAELLDAYAERLAAFRRGASVLNNIRLIDTGDPGKLVFYGQGMARLSALLDERFGLVMEAAHERHMIAMTSVMDTDEGFARLLAALTDMDKTWPPPPPLKREAAPPPQVVLSPREAPARPKRVLPADRAVGMVSAGLVISYPPGIPLLAPGERVFAGLSGDIEVLGE